MKKVVHDSRARLRALTSFIQTHVTALSRAYEVSDVKGDGTVFVRFRSVEGESSIELGKAFERALEGHGLAFTVPEPGKVRVALDRFPTETV